jgi:hypothetical protein
VLAVLRLILGIPTGCGKGTVGIVCIPCAILRLFTMVPFLDGKMSRFPRKVR